MGNPFDSGPSDSDIKKQEQKAHERETERLRLAEQKLRNRESKETMEGAGVASSLDITLGSDLTDDERLIDLEEFWAKPITATRSDESTRKLAKAGKLGPEDPYGTNLSL